MMKEDESIADLMDEIECIRVEHRSTNYIIGLLYYYCIIP